MNSFNSTRTNPSRIWYPKLGQKLVLVTISWFSFFFFFWSNLVFFYQSDFRLGYSDINDISRGHWKLEMDPPWGCWETRISHKAGTINWAGCLGGKKCILSMDLGMLKKWEGNPTPSFGPHSSRRLTAERARVWPRQREAHINQYWNEKEIWLIPSFDC